MPIVPVPSASKLSVRGARVHNLKNVDLEIPRDSLVVFTGLSGAISLTRRVGGARMAEFNLAEPVRRIEVELPPNAPSEAGTPITVMPKRWQLFA